MSSSNVSCSNFLRACVLQNLKVKCKCDKNAYVKIFRTYWNPYKRFFSWRDHVCGFVDWAYPIGCPCHDKSSAGNADEVDQVHDVVKSMDGRLLGVETNLETTMCDEKLQGSSPLR
ncbi:hypothetical protein P8452_38199 [Trifolium repens]|nr:hypothetical protein P8452_38199 [Trifolium repens]